MQTRSISVTEAARNFSDCVNRTRYQGVTFILHRNGVPVARLVPESTKQSLPADEAPAASAEESNTDTTVALEATDPQIPAQSKSVW
jgi:antitoxin (DNA-binding transcriptional repressor) of toxin-antitoxin stability system